MYRHRKILRHNILKASQNYNTRKIDLCIYAYIMWMYKYMGEGLKL